MADELVFTVSGATATPAAAVSLAEIGLLERQHLQEWVIAHPEILGPRIMVVTFEFDRWWAAGGSLLDRLDVLGLDQAGRLVVAELKRDAAPDTVEMQAIKYAAMASRFTPEALASQHARFLSSRGQVVTDEDALAALEEHTEDKMLSVETLRQPRVVLVAASFPPVVTATAVWLREMGLDVSLIRFQAYRTCHETLVTVSQLFPVPTVEEFTVVPRASTRAADQLEYSADPLSAGDFAALASSVSNPGVRGALDLCAGRPGEWVSYADICAHTGRTRPQFRADLAGLTRLVKKRLGKISWPFEVQWNPGKDDYYYSMDDEQAAWWTAATAPAEDVPATEPPGTGHDGA